MRKWKDLEADPDPDPYLLLTDPDPQTWFADIVVLVCFIFLPCNLIRPISDVYFYATISLYISMTIKKQRKKTVLKKKFKTSDTVNVLYNA
jgi:hypothetical protein